MITHMTITGEFLTRHCRDLVLEGRARFAWQTLARGLMGEGAEEVATAVLRGTMELIGDSTTGIDTRDTDPDEEYLAQVRHFYAGRVETDTGWSRPVAVIAEYCSESGRWAARHGNSTGPQGLREWTQRRADWHCADGETAHLLTLGRNVEGRSVSEDSREAAHIIFEACGEPPHWLDEHNRDEQAALVDALAKDRRLTRRGELMPIRSVTRLMTDELTSDGLNDEAEDLRDLADEATADERELRQADIGDQVRGRAGDEVFTLTLLDGSDVVVPRAPFVCWALWRTHPDVMPDWETVSGSGHKMPCDDPYHTDWALGAGLTLGRDDPRDCYHDNVNRPAWDELGRIQESQMDRECPDVPAGIMSALSQLRDSVHRAAVIIDGGPVTGIVGETVAVLPGLGVNVVAELDGIAAIIAEVGGPASHLAVLAAGRTVMRLADACLIFEPGQFVTIDPKAGTITVDA